MDEHFLTEIEIKQFKCFTDFKASGFKRVNLIGGKNNIGKTAFMEACYINVHSININAIMTAIYSVNHARENLNIVNKSIFYEKITDATKKYTAKSNLKYTDFKITDIDARKEYHFVINDNSKNIDSKNDFYTNDAFQQFSPRKLDSLSNDNSTNNPWQEFPGGL